MSTNPPATFASCRDPRRFTVLGYDIHVSDTQPVLPAGYQRTLGAVAGSGPAPMSFEVDDDIVETLADQFSFRAGVRATETIKSDQALVAIMLYPGLGTMARELVRQFPDDCLPGRLSFGPIWHLWAVAAEAVGMSATQVDGWLGDGDDFGRLADLAIRVHGRDLAWFPLGATYRVEQQRYFREIRLHALNVVEFRHALRNVGGGLTRAFGMFPTGVDPDPCQIRPDSIIAGDGTVTAAPTKVIEHRQDSEDCLFSTVFHEGSKATNPRRARVNRTPKFTDRKDAGLTKEEKADRPSGRNHVFTLTRVVGQGHTRVLFDVDQVPLSTNEEPVAAEMIVALAATFEGALHHVAYDMAILPKWRNRLFDRAGVTTVSRNKSYTDAEFVAARLVGGPAYGLTIRRRRFVHAATNNHLRKLAGKPLPSEIRKTTHAVLGHFEHSLADGSRCSHALVGDDGHLVEILDDHLGIPAAPIELTGPFDGSIHHWAGPTPAATGQHPRVGLSRYVLECSTSGDVFNLWLERRPCLAPLNDQHRWIDQYVRPVAEPSEGFTLAHSIRQDPESSNSVLKDILGYKCRASSSDPLAQWWAMVGFVVAGNADTWVRHTVLRIHGATARAAQTSATEIASMQAARS